MNTNSRLIFIFTGLFTFYGLLAQAAAQPAPPKKDAFDLMSLGPFLLNSSCYDVTRVINQLNDGSPNEFSDLVGREVWKHGDECETPQLKREGRQFSWIIPSKESDPGSSYFQFDFNGKGGLVSMHRSQQWKTIDTAPRLDGLRNKLTQRYGRPFLEVRYREARMTHVKQFWGAGTVNPSVTKVLNLEKSPDCENQKGIGAILRCAEKYMADVQRRIVAATAIERDSLIQAEIYWFYEHPEFVITFKLNVSNVSQAKAWSENFRADSERSSSQWAKEQQERGKANLPNF